MCGMRPMAQRIQEQDVEPVQHLHRCRRNGTVVSQIRSRAHSISVDLRITMHDGYRNKLCTEQVEWAMHLMEHDLRDTAELVIIVEDIAEDPRERWDGVGVRVYRNAA